jgi:hypothetical protein
VPDSENTLSARVAALERDARDHSKSITEIVLVQRETNKDVDRLQEAKAVEEVKNAYRDEKIANINGIGKLVVTTVIVLFIGAVFAALKLGLFNV